MSPIRWLLSVMMLLLSSDMYGASITGTIHNSNTSGPRASNKDRFVYERYRNIPSEYLGEREEPDLYLPDIWDAKAPMGSMSQDSTNIQDDNTGLWPQDVQLFAGRGSHAVMEKRVGSEEYRQASKREGHSLSIVNPLDVLRQRLMLEMARRRMKENQDQIKANDVILKTLGKRGGNQVGGDIKKKKGSGQGGANERRWSQRREELLDTPEEPASYEFEV